MTAPAATTTAQTQLAQEAVAVGLASALRGIVLNADIGNLRQAIPSIAAAVAALVHRYSLGSATLAVQHYHAERSAAKVPGRFTVIPARPAPLRQVGQSVDWATQPLWSHDPDLEAAERNVVAAAERLVMDAARDTIVDNVHRDPKARGWARMPEAGGCAFCYLLASRGVVYKSDRTAGFRSHDHCRCQAVPDFGQYEMPDAVAKARELYYSLPHGNPAEMRRNFRRAFEK